MKRCIVMLSLLILVLPVLHAQSRADIRYVLAQSGLNLRASQDPASARLVKMPYGAEVTLLAEPSIDDMQVDQIAGGMAQVRFDGHIGWAFDGYMGICPGPAQEMGVEAYMESLRKLGFSVMYEHCTRDWNGYFQEEEKIMIADIGFEEAFLIARGFGLSDPIPFPQRGSEQELVMVNPEKQELMWADQVHATWNDAGKLTEIRHVFRREGGGQVIFIQREGESAFMGISVMQVAD